MAKDPFREPWNVRRVTGIAALFILLALGFVLANNPAIPPPRKVFGIVTSSGPVAFNKYRGSTIESTSIRLADGNVVLAYTVLGESQPLSAGDAVSLWEQPRLLGPPSYEVIARR